MERVFFVWRYKNSAPQASALTFLSDDMRMPTGSKRARRYSRAEISSWKPGTRAEIFPQRAQARLPSLRRFRALVIIQFPQRAQARLPSLRRFRALVIVQFPLRAQARLPSLRRFRALVIVQFPQRAQARRVCLACQRICLPSLQAMRASFSDSRFAQPS